MKCACCERTVQLKPCDTCNVLLCWRHLAKEKHPCAPLPQEAISQQEGMEIEAEASRKRKLASSLLAGNADADRLGNDRVIPPKKVKCKATDDALLVITALPEPMAIIYAFDEPITFSAILDDDKEEVASCEWFIDGNRAGLTTEATWEARFRPRDVIEDRRRDYLVAVKVTTNSGRRKKSHDVLIRVAQQGVCGSPLPAPSTEGLLATCGAMVAEKKHLFRDPHGRTLVYSADLVGPDMVSNTTTGLLATDVVVGPGAFRWDGEALKVLLKHELVHCKHFALVPQISEFWYHICDKSQGLGTEHLRQATEVEAYLTSFEDPSTSYKFLLEAGPIESFLLCYQGTIKVLNEEFKHSTARQCLAYLGQCRARAYAVFPELKRASIYREIAVTRKRYNEDNPLQYPMM